MTVTIVGSQLGDEGKGGVVDLFGADADLVVRYQGGDNAGHTVVESGEEYKLSLTPSGVVRGKTGLLGNGCVVNPTTLFDEIDALRERGLDPEVKVAKRAHTILPYHRVLDGIEEDAKSEENLEAGTTGRGIGPTYEDKIGRRGIRIGDLLDPDVLREKLEYVVPQKRALAEDVFGVDPDETASPEMDAPFDVDALFEMYRAFGERLAEEDMPVNGGQFIADRINEGANVMFEGAQGTSLDIDHGDYPFVTSSNPTAGYAATGSGVGPTVVGQGAVIGVVKAYLSRVGTGQLPTELGGEDEELATYIRDKGGEYGTVTGRPRRIGWLDLPMVRHAARVSGFTAIAVNHIDTLAGLDEIKVGHSYDLDGEEIFTMPATDAEWSRCEPNLKTFDGWPEANWEAVAEEGYDALPENAKTYLDYVSEEIGADVCAVGLGPGREETVVLDHPFE